MHTGYRKRIGRSLTLTALTLLVICARKPALADSHLPIIDFTPTIGWSLTSDGGDPPITAGKLPFTPGNPPTENGFTTLNGTATIPIFKNFSLSYDRIGNGSFDSLLSSIHVGGQTIYPGSTTDLLQNYRADYHLGHFNIEGGFASRYRQCCPADFLEWHKGFLGVSYATPPFKLLNNGFFVFGITGNAANHHSSPDVRAQLGSLDLPDKMLYTTQQAITAIIPVNAHTGIRTATTYLWGALDYPEHAPFPYYYGIFIASATKQVTNDFGLTATIANVQQRIQGYPFPRPYAIRTAALTIAANFHVDFNKMFVSVKPATPGRPTSPGVPGGPGGPAQVGPTQGGTVSPSPSPQPTAMP